MSEQEHPEPRSSPRDRLLCHIAVFLPLLGLPLLWVGSVLALRRPPAPADGEARRWRRRLFALTAVDSVLLLVLTLVLPALWTPAPSQTIAGPVQLPRRVIGVRLDTKEARRGGVRVDAVLPGSPAARAGVRQGDRVLAVDGSAVTRFTEVQQALQQGPQGRARRLRIRRGEQQVTLNVIPESTGPARRRGMFGPRPGESCAPGDLAAFEVRQWAPMIAMLVTLLVLGAWKRMQPPRLWVALALLPPASLLGGVLALIGLCQLLGGPCLGGSALGMMVGEVLLLAGGWVLGRRLRREGALEGVIVRPRIGLGQSVGRGLGYMVAGGIRLAILIASASVGLLQGAGASNLALQEAIRSVSLGVGGVALLFLLAVVVGPAAEEVYFRGLVLPWLARRLGPAWGLWISSLLFGLLHLHYGISTPLAVFYGYVLGWARLRTGGLWAPFLLHATMNLVSGSALVAG